MRIIRIIKSLNNKFLNKRKTGRCKVLFWYLKKHIFVRQTLFIINSICIIILKLRLLVQHLE